MVERRGQEVRDHRQRRLEKYSSTGNLCSQFFVLAIDERMHLQFSRWANHFLGQLQFVSCV